jgi:hypothetical protein
MNNNEQNEAKNALSEDKIASLETDEVTAEDLEKVSGGTGMTTGICVGSAGVTCR